MWLCSRTPLGMRICRATAGARAWVMKLSWWVRALTLMSALRRSVSLRLPTNPLELRSTTVGHVMSMRERRAFCILPLMATLMLTGWSGRLRSSALGISDDAPQTMSPRPSEARRSMFILPGWRLSKALKSISTRPLTLEWVVVRARVGRCIASESMAMRVASEVRLSPLFSANAALRTTASMRGAQ